MPKTRSRPVSISTTMEGKVLAAEAAPDTNRTTVRTTRRIFGAYMAERIGFLGVHPDIADKAALLDALTLANRILGFVNAPALMQRVVAKLPDVSVDCAIYARRRALFREILDAAGLEYLDPKGAFYFFPKSPIEDDVAFCGLLQEQKILAVPGRGFGTPGHFRLAFSVPDDVIERSADGFQAAMRAV